MSRPRAYVQIDLVAYKNNISRLRKDSKAEFLAVVKANAYGHGIIEIAQAAVSAGANWLGVALPEEAIQLRAAGIKIPIIAWLLPIGDEIKTAISQNIDLGFSTIAQLKAIEKFGQELGITPRVHIEVDTGMSRGGFLDQWEELLEILPTAKVEVIGLWSHFARADEPNRIETTNQINKFAQYEAELKTAGINPKYFHLSNSAGILSFPSADRSIIRGGIATYGLTPDMDNLGDSISLGLTPVMSIYAQVIAVKQVPKGAQVGYGGIHTLTEDTKIGIVAMGYSDGLPRRSDESVGGYFANKFAPLIGRISMDQCVVNLNHIPELKAGDYLQILGPGACSAEDWGKASGTINYEIVTRIPTRLPRVAKE